MTWDQVYERMKIMLDAHGLTWKDRDQVTVSIEGDNLCFAYRNDTFSFKVNVNAEASDEAL